MQIPLIEGQIVSVLSWEWLRGTYVRLLSSGAQLLLLVLGVHAQQHGVWLLCLGLIALISVFAWLSTLYRVRMLRNTPTSTVAAAAQGHVELNGRGQHFCDTPLLSPLKARPCLWCRYKVETRHDGEWRTQDRGETITSFVLRDRTGSCLVDPETAEITTRHREQWTVGDTRYTEWLLLPGDALRAIGQFRTQSGGESFDSRDELSALLAEWKADMPRLLARYDSNHNGALDASEWEAVRRDAMQEVLKIRDQLRLQPETHTLSRPANGQLFLISNLPQGKLERRFLLWGWLHLGIFFLALWGMGWV